MSFVQSSYSFPEKLYLILASDVYDEYIQWSPEGLCFRIIDEEGFIEKVIPKYFKQSKMTSFQRQLNSYGFRKIHRGKDIGCYFHPKFQRDHVELLDEVHRVIGRMDLPSYEEVVRCIEIGKKYPRARPFYPKHQVNNQSHLVATCTCEDRQGLGSSSPFHNISDPSLSPDSDVSSLTSGSDHDDQENYSGNQFPLSRQKPFILTPITVDSVGQEPLFFHVPSPLKRAATCRVWFGEDHLSGGAEDLLSPSGRFDYEELKGYNLGCSSFDVDETERKQDSMVVREDPFQEELEERSWFLVNNQSNSSSSTSKCSGGAVLTANLYYPSQVVAARSNCYFSGAGQYSPSSSAAYPQAYYFYI